MTNTPEFLAPSSGHFVWIKLSLLSKRISIARHIKKPAPVEAASADSTGESCCNA